MHPLRRAYVRFYPTLLLAMTIAQRALALDCSAVDQEGNPVPEGTVIETHQRVEVAVHQQVAAAHVTYRFLNKHTAQVELTCDLRLQQRELVEAFSYWNGNEHIVGEVLERATATEVYESLAKVQRRDPGILEQNGQTFRFRVFPVAPGEEKKVELSTVTTLTLNEGWLEYAVPRGNLPRSSPFAFAANVTDGGPITDVEVLGGEAAPWRVGPQQVRLAFSADHMAEDRDVVLRYRLARPANALRVTAHHEVGGDGTFMLIVSPKELVEQRDVVGRDIVFVTDISGSMAGEPLEQAKLGLLAMLGQLGKEDRFEVVSFDDESYPLFGKLVEHSQRTQEEALAGVAALETKGGTNIHGALLRALDLLGPAPHGRARAIVFMTDGQGGDPEVVAADVRARNKDVRIHSFGVGTGVDRFFLDRLSRDNRGTATFISDSTRIASAMQQLYQRIAMPLLTDLELEVSGVQVNSLYPKELPDLYRDGELIVFGRYTGGGRARFELTGKLRSGQEQLDLVAELPTEQPLHAEIEKLWASERIHHMLAMNLRAADPELEREVTRLGIVYNLVTPYTTFLAVPESLQTAEVKAQLRTGRMGYGKKLIDSMQGVRLSQSFIPPGDPVLTVDAPAGAKEVVAYFPFGLTKRLSWDEQRGRWYVRFLVPRDVEDGEYTVRLRIVHADGKLEWKEIDYTIDASAPELDVIADEFAMPGEPLRFEVDAQEPLREIYAYFPRVKGKAGRRFPLKFDGDKGLFGANLPIPEDLDADRLVVRVVARDRARNRIEYQVTVPVLSGFDCCEDEEETCGLLSPGAEEAGEGAPSPAPEPVPAKPVQAAARRAAAPRPAAARSQAPARSARSNG